MYLIKKKYGKGKYRIRYFIVNNNLKKPEKSKNKKSGYSEYIKIK